MRWRYLHIPKTAGSSFRKAYGHGTEQGHPHLPGDMFKDVLTVATMRDPLDRMVSICCHLHSGLVGRTHRGQPEYVTPQIFTDWVLSGMPLTIANGKVSAGYAVDVLKLTILAPQTRWLNEDTKILRFHNLEHDALLFHKVMLGVDQCKKLDHSNVSRRQPNLDLSQWYYNHEVLDIVSGKYMDDMDKWSDVLKDYIWGGTSPVDHCEDCNAPLKHCQCGIPEPPYYM